MNQAVERALIDYSNDIWDQAMKAGASEERERIIKLLQENSFANWVEIKLENLIELIKGETK
jgi:hypothetical protein